MAKPDYQRIKTRPMVVRSVARLVGMVAALQFALSALALYLPRPVMFFFWAFATGAAGWAAFHTEIVKSRWIG